MESHKGFVTRIRRNFIWFLHIFGIIKVIYFYDFMGSTNIQFTIIIVIRFAYIFREVLTDLESRKQNCS